MKINLENQKGYVILDDLTGRILYCFISEAIEGKWDYVTKGSWTRQGDKHYAFYRDTSPKDNLTKEEVEG